MTSIQVTPTCLRPNSRESCGATEDNPLGTECKPGEICQNHQCQCGLGLVRCDGECIDPQINNHWCGADESCHSAAVCSIDSGEICIDGKCTNIIDADFSSLCQPDTCEDEKACYPQKLNATEPQCQTCLDSQTKCLGWCIEQADPELHLVSCHDKIAECEPNRGNCNEYIADGCETELLTDDAHCGSCENFCPHTTHCEAGTCCIEQSTSAVADKTGKAIALDCCTHNYSIKCIDKSTSPMRIWCRPRTEGCPEGYEEE